jgi:hypothetical protein
MKLYEYFFGAKGISGLAKGVDAAGMAAKAAKAAKYAAGNAAALAAKAAKATKGSVEAATQAAKASRAAAAAKRLGDVADAAAAAAKAGKSTKALTAGVGGAASGTKGLTTAAKEALRRKIIAKLDTLRAALAKGTKGGSKGAKGVLSRAGKGALKFAKNHPMLIGFGLTAAGLAIYASATGKTFEQALAEMIRAPLEFVQNVQEEVSKSGAEKDPELQAALTEAEVGTDSANETDFDPDAVSDEEDPEYLDDLEYLDEDYEDESGFDSGYSDFADSIGVSPDNLTYIFIGIFFLIIIILIMKKKKAPSSN